MIKPIFYRVAVTIGKALWVLPFLGAIFLGSVILSLVWLKNLMQFLILDSFQPSGKYLVRIFSLSTAKSAQLDELRPSLNATPIYQNAKHERSPSHF